jgi:hypothetical protein
MLSGLSSSTCFLEISSAILEIKRRAAGGEYLFSRRLMNRTTIFVLRVPIANLRSLGMLAAYLIPFKVLLIPREWTFESSEQESFLAHELQHALDFTQPPLTSRVVNLARTSSGATSLVTIALVLFQIASLLIVTDPVTQSLVTAFSAVFTCILLALAWASRPGTDSYKVSGVERSARVAEVMFRIKGRLALGDKVHPDRPTFVRNFIKAYEGVKGLPVYNPDGSDVEKVDAYILEAFPAIVVSSMSFRSAYARLNVEGN